MIQRFKYFKEKNKKKYQKFKSSVSTYILLKWCTLNQILFYLSMAQNSALLGIIFCPQEDLSKLGL